MFSCWEKLAIEIQTSTCRVVRCKHIRDRFVRLTAPAAPALSVHLGPAIQPSITDFALSGECECFIRQSAEIEQLFTEGRVVVCCGGGDTAPRSGSGQTTIISLQNDNTGELRALGLSLLST